MRPWPTTPFILPSTVELAAACAPCIFARLRAWYLKCPNLRLYLVLRAGQDVGVASSVGVRLKRGLQVAKRAAECESVFKSSRCRAGQVSLRLLDDGLIGRSVVTIRDRSLKRFRNCGACGGRCVQMRSY